MAVLNIEALRKLAEDKNLFEGKHLEESFQPSSYDLRIGTIYKKGKIHSESHPDPKCYYVKLKPSEIITLLTFEEINMPQDHCGTVFAKNSLSSTGLLILNPGHIDPGFEGPISICAINLSKKVIKLRLEDSIFSLIIEKLDKQVPEEDKYKNPVYKTRKELEEIQYKNRFSDLSNSFFDLVLGYEKANELLIDRIYDQAKVYIKKGIAALLILAALLSALYFFFPKSFIFNNRQEETEEAQKKIILLEDSLKNLKIELDNEKGKKIEDTATGATGASNS